VFAGVATPTQDPITMLALALPLCLLFELSVLFARWNDRRRARKDAESEWAGSGTTRHRRRPRRGKHHCRSTRHRRRRRSSTIHSVSARGRRAAGRFAHDDAN